MRSNFFRSFLREHLEDVRGFAVNLPNAWKGCVGVESEWGHRSVNED